MHLFIATLSTETNTFSPVPTSISGYEEYYLRHGTATQDPPNLMTEALHCWRKSAELRGWQVTESLTAIAEPAGRTTASTWQALKGEILEDLCNAGPVDIVLLQLHGAMVAEGEDDCEGAITTEIRQLCPDAVIGISLDLHCHLTPAMMSACDLIVTFKEYPHDDAEARAQELFDLARRTRMGEIRPVKACHDCNMIAIYLTKTGAMQEFVQHMLQLEQEKDILSVSLAHGFPWADIVENDTRTLVITDGNPELADQTARALRDTFFSLRHQVTQQYPDLDDALSQYSNSLPVTAPVVLADMSDNSGAGAPGDATYVLKELLERDISDAASGLYWDPIAVRVCQDAGEGTRLTLRLGGKTEVASGLPLDITGTVVRIRSGLVQHLGPAAEPLGTMVWFRTDSGLDLVINDLRIQVYHPEVFEQMGIDLHQKSLVVVKSLFHFYTPFASIASKVIFCATPGRVNPDTRTIPFKLRRLDFWPVVESSS